MERRMAREAVALRPVEWLRVALAMAALGFVLVLPALIEGDALSGDAPVHVRWQAQFAQAVWHGTLYPRWLPGMNDGFGSPAFFFYPPLVQWLGAAFHPLLPGDANAMNRLILGVWAISAIGGVGCWLWLRTLRLTAAAAWLGALLFLLMPYRCFVDFYQRGAIPELTAICVMPWLLAFATRLRQGGRGAWGSYALSVGAILYSHLPGALIGILFASAYIAALALPRDWRFLLKGASASVAGAMIGALCIATALGLLGRITDPTAMWGARNQPMNWLLLSAAPWVDPSMHLMTLALALAALFAGAVLTAVALGDPDRRLRPVVLFLAAAILVVFLLNTAPSRPFWALQTPLSRIQFPFRMLSVHAVALSGLAAIAFDRLGAPDGNARRLRALFWLGVPALFLADGGMLAYQTWRNRDDRPQTNAEMLASTQDTSEYVLGRLGAVRPRFGSANSWTVSGKADARLLARKSRDIVLAVDARTGSTLALRQFAFTGWQCRVDRGEWVAAARIAYPFELPACTVPAGRHRLEARMPPTAFETAGGWLTLLGLGLALLDLSGAFGRMRRAGEAD